MKTLPGKYLVQSIFKHCFPDTMSISLVVFDSHPVQYRVPVWQAIEKETPGNIHVVYASDCSVRGHADKGFGQTFKWDDPMMEGYPHTVLNCEKGEPLSGADSLTGEGVEECFDRLKPQAVLLTGLNYKFDRVVYRHALKKRIPVWLRCETQDEALPRSFVKSLLRSFVYRRYYRNISKFFYIGALNRKHYLANGVPDSKLYKAYYATVDRFIALNEEEKRALRKSARDHAAIADNKIVIGFSGKFIQKKNPSILFEMLAALPEQIRQRVVLYFIGSGELQKLLEGFATTAENLYGVKTFFAGFVNQSELARHYLAIDTLILPSRRMGETWGLVANEAMQAGCSVIVSDAVGCHANFADWQRFKIFKEGDSSELAKQVELLSVFDRDFNWARHELTEYSISAIAHSFIKEMSTQKDKG